MGRGSSISQKRNQPKLKTSSSVLYGETGPRGSKPHVRRGVFKWLEDKKLDKIVIHYSGNYGAADAFVHTAIDKEGQRVEVEAERLLEKVIGEVDRNYQDWTYAEHGSGGSITIDVDDYQIVFDHEENYLDHESISHSVTIPDTIKAELQIIGASRVEMSYDGYGDDGSISSFVIIDENGDNVAERAEREHPWAAQAVQMHLRNLLSGFAPGWQDNEGSSGTIHIDCADDAILLEHERRFLDSNSSSFIVENLEIK